MGNISQEVQAIEKETEQLRKSKDSREKLVRGIQETRVILNQVDPYILSEQFENSYLNSLTEGELHVVALLHAHDGKNQERFEALSAKIDRLEKFVFRSVLGLGITGLAYAVIPKLIGSVGKSQIVGTGKSPFSDTSAAATARPRGRKVESGSVIPLFDRKAS